MGCAVTKGQQSQRHASCAPFTCTRQVGALLAVNANARRPVRVKLSSQLASSPTPAALTYSYSMRAFSAATGAKPGSFGLGRRVILPLEHHAQKTGNAPLDRHTVQSDHGVNPHSRVL